MIDPIALDDIDRALLRHLSQDAGLSASALGKRVGLSQPAAGRRGQRRPAAGVLSGARRDRARAARGVGVTVVVGVKLGTKGR
ncbi:MAG: Lrp/AsnC family transcriptional regulator, partial [Pseudomonadota bacterium]|nr:Lrp/AsnC family transcriptional regulator [Pseudomonadota bacterium]